MNQSERQPLASERDTNVRQLLCLLPPEILVCIVLDLIHTPHRDVKTQSIEQHRHPYMIEHALIVLSSNWVHMLAVCAHIRAILQATPSLWSFIDAAWKLAFIEECLARSASLPLTIVCFRHQGSMDTLLSRGNLSQASTIQLENRFTVHQPTSWSEEFNNRMPLLRHLTMLWGQLKLRKTLLGGAFDNIQTLRVSNARLYDPVIMPRLTHLSLELVAIEGRNYDILLETLISALMLEVLYLNMVKHKGRKRDLLADEKWEAASITLSHLRILSLRDTAILLWRVLRVLPNPSSQLCVNVIDIGFPWEQNPEWNQASWLILDRIRQYWRATSGNTLLPGGIFNASSYEIACMFESSADGMNATEANTSTLPPCLFYHAACLIAPQHTHMEDLVKVRLEMDQMWFSLEDAPLLNSLSNIGKLVLEHITPQSLPRLKGLQAWLRKRKELGHPVCTLLFLADATVHADQLRSQLQELADEAGPIGHGYVQDVDIHWE
jgi:hypothetical protein